MLTFNQGDRCIYISRETKFIPLTTGKTYIITKVDQFGHLFLVNDLGFAWPYCAERFERVPRIERKKINVTV